MSHGDQISFARGAPSLDIVDIEGLRAAADRAFQLDPGGLAGYGTAMGYRPLREWIAKRHDVPIDQVLVTNGSLQADAFLFDQFVESGSAVVVERPTYDRTLLSLRQRRADVHAVALEPDGIDVEAVEALLRSGTRVKLAHVIPNFHNPAGYTLSEEKRLALLRLAREHDFTIFEDDPYIDIRFSGQSLPRMLDSAEAEEVVYASSFSKTVCPGIRVGYLIGSPNVIKEIGLAATTTYISPNMVAQGIVNQFCRSECFQVAVENIKSELRSRCETLCSELRDQLPDAEFVQPEGGYFLWVTLPQSVDIAQLGARAKELGVAFVPGTDFIADGGQNQLRLAYSGVAKADIKEGVRRLAQAYQGDAQL